MKTEEMLRAEDAPPIVPTDQVLIIDRSLYLVNA
jgi:hypothetical protein